MTTKKERTMADESTKAWRCAAVALMCAMGLLGCGGSDNEAADDGGAGGADAANSDDPGGGDGNVRGSDDDGDPSAPVSEGPASSLEVGTLRAGATEFDLLGTPATITTDREWFVPVAQPTVAIFEDPDAAQPETQAVLLMRPTGFLSQGDVATQYLDVTGPTDDIDGWISTVGFEVADRMETSVAGRPTTLITGSYPGASDAFATFLRTNAPVAFNGTPDGDYIYVRREHTYRIWLIDQAEFDPIVAMAIVAEGDEAWFSVADALVSGLRLGDPEPHPNPPPEPENDCRDFAAGFTGEANTGFGGGMRFESTMPVDYSGGGGPGPGGRMEFYAPGEEPFAVGFSVLGPADDNGDFTDAASALAFALGDQEPAQTFDQTGFGTRSTMVVVEGESGFGIPPVARISFGNGTDEAIVRNGEAFGFFDTDAGVFMVHVLPSSIDGELALPLALASDIVSTMELIPGLCE